MSKTNIIGASKLPTNNGSAKAAVTISSLGVNNNYKPYSGGSQYHIIQFPTNIYGEYGIKKLSKSMNDIQFKENQFGVNANVTIFVKKTETDAQFLYLTERIKKGGRLRIVHATATFNEYGLQLSVNANDINFIEEPKPKEETDQKVEEAAETTGGITASELMSSYEEVDYDVDSAGI